MAGAQFAAFNATMSPRRAACARCRQQKLRCLFEIDKNQCSRCLRAQVSCVLNSDKQNKTGRKARMVEKVSASLEPTSEVGCSVFQPTNDIGNESFPVIARPSNDTSPSGESFLTF